MTLAMLMECVFGDDDEDAIERLQRLRDEPKIDDYYPASTMPTDSMFVVRAPLLKEFEDSINQVAATEESPDQRMERIGTYVDKTHAAGGTKEDAYKALAKIDGCGIQAIKNVYKRYRINR